MLPSMFRISNFIWRSFSPRLLILAVVLLFACALEVTAVGEVVWAVNCGGEAHVDQFGVHYQRDWLNIGHASSHGRSIPIRRVPLQDQILYQTERYYTSNFAYDLPIKVDGDYVLVMKFSEVWFTRPNQKVFNVQLNYEHTIVDRLDIFASAGFGIAHDEIVPFSVRKGQLHVNKESSSFDGTLHVEFIKLGLDNPKINAMYVIRGKIEDVPRLSALQVADDQSEDADEVDEEEHEMSTEPKRHRRVVEPRVTDPYATEDSSSMLVPVAIAIGIFIPLVFCLCKL